jgi:hypothetical protein
MNDRRDPQTSHAARISGVSGRERTAFITTIALLGMFVVALAIPGDGELSAIVNDPDRPSLLPSSTMPVASIPPDTVPPNPTWAANAVEFRGSIGESFDFQCPPNGTLEPIWGTSVYADSSSVCTAAVHLAFITPDLGGQVQIVIRPGSESYEGTTLNGISSGSRGRWPGSFEMRGPPPWTGEPAKPGPPDGPWGATAVSHRGAFDQEFDYDCPANGQTGPVWGTGTYTDDSSVCTAAVHDGLITREDGGTVRISIRSGRASYPGSFRNGVRSMPWDRWDGSFDFFQPDSGPPLTSFETAERHRSAIGQEFRYDCLPDGPVGPVWGTAVYTDDSSVCTAAVHAGVIILGEGGTVTIVIEPGLDSYTGSNRNGVSSESWGRWAGSFRILGP